MENLPAKTEEKNLSQKAINALIRSEAKDRWQKLDEILRESPYQNLKIIAKRMKRSVGKTLRDIEYLARKGSPYAIEFKRHQTQLKIDNDKENQRVRQILNDNVYANHLELSKRLDMDFMEWNQRLVALEKEQKKSERSLKALVSRQAKVKEYLRQHPCASLVEVSRQTRIPLDKLEEDMKKLEHDRYKKLQMSYQIDGLVDLLNEKAMFCFRQADISVQIDARTGSRWVEEARKLLSLAADLKKMKSKDVDINIYDRSAHTKQQRDEIIDIAMEGLAIEQK